MGAITLGLLWSGKLGGGIRPDKPLGNIFSFCPLIASSPYYTRLYNL